MWLHMVRTDSNDYVLISAFEATFDKECASRTSGVVPEVYNKALVEFENLLRKSRRSKYVAVIAKD